MKRLIAYSCFSFLAFNICIGQTVEKKTRLFAQEYVYAHNSYPKGYAYTHMDSLFLRCSITQYATKKIGNAEVKIYFFGQNSSHSKTYILIEKKRTSTSDFAVVGDGKDFQDIETMGYFFHKYPFPEKVEQYIYYYLASNHTYHLLMNNKVFQEDTFFSYHR